MALHTKPPVFVKGQTIHHEFFGTGTITAAKQRGMEQTLSVDFDDGKKRDVLGDKVKFPTEVKSTLSVGPEEPVKTKPKPEPTRRPAPGKSVTERATMLREREHEAAEVALLGSIQHDEKLWTRSLTAKDIRSQLTERGLEPKGSKAAMTTALKDWLEARYEKSVFVVKPEPAPEPEPAEPEPEPAPEKDTPASKAKSAGFASADAYGNAMLKAPDTTVFNAMESDPWLFSSWLTTKQLKGMLKERGVGTSGNKGQLTARLHRHVERKATRGPVTPEVTVTAPDWQMPKLDASVTRQSIAKELSAFNKAQLIALADKAGKDIDGSLVDLKARLTPPYKHIDKMNTDEMKFELASEGVTGGQLIGRKTVLRGRLKKKWAADGYDEQHLFFELPADVTTTERLAHRLENEAKTATPKKAKDLLAQAAKIRSATKEDTKKKAREARKTARAAARAKRTAVEEEEEPVTIVEPTPTVEKEKPTIVKGKAGYPAWWEKVWAEQTAAGKTIDPEEFFTTQNMADFAKKAMLPTKDRSLKGTAIPSDCKNIKYTDLTDKGQMWFNKWGRGLCTWLSGATLRVKKGQRKYTQLNPEGNVKRETPVETAKQMRACRDMMWELRDVLAPSACSYRHKTGEQKKA